MQSRRFKILTLFILGAALILAAAIANNPKNLETLKSLVARHVPPLRKPFERIPKVSVEDRLAAASFRLGQPILIRIYKEESILEVWMQRADRYEKLWSYPICQWSGALGPKLKEGDKQSPEGYYFASSRQLLPSSRHHRAINTGFPNSFDQSHGRTGTALMIHGSCSSIGCYAMTDPAIDDIYNIVEAALVKGQPAIPMHLYPFRMTEENLKRHVNHPWIDFWRNLAEGDRHFAATGKPPSVWSCNGKYHFAGTLRNCQKVAAW